MEEVLDQQAVNLAKAIRQVETGGNQKARGGSGEIGAYQFMPDTWKTTAPKYGVNVDLEKSTLEDQNKVAYHQIKEWKDAGYNPDAIASMWNSGKPKYEGNKGVNSKGIKFDVPAYVASVGKAYQTIKGGGEVGVDPQNPSSTTGTQMEQKPNPYGAKFTATGDENLLTGVAKAVGNIPSSALNLAENLGGTILHPIKTVKNIGDVISGGVEKGTDALGLTTNVDTQEKQKFNAVISGLKDRYGSIENLKKTAINDPAGLALDVATVLEGGGAALKGAGLLGKTGEVAANVGKVINPVNVVGKTAGLIGKGIGRVASDTIGLATGAGGETIRQGLKATVEGGDAYKSFVNGLKGGVEPEDLVNQAQGALKEVVDTRNASYQEMLKRLKGDTTVYNPAPIQDTLQKQLVNFGIKEGQDGLDFSRSKFALDGTTQKDISNLYSYIKEWGTKEGDLSAVGIDKLKQIISSYYSPSSDYRSFTEALRKSTRGVLEKAPGYSKEMKNFADATEWINETRKGLSLGDKAMTETAFKKLTTAFKQNNEWRAEALQELDRVTGGQLKATIAGQQLSSIIPRGLAKFGYGLEGVEAMHTALAGGVGFIPLLASMMVSSPYLVGRFLQVLGLGTRGTELMMKYLGQVNPGSVAEVANVGQKFNQNSGMIKK